MHGSYIHEMATILQITLHMTSQTVKNTIRGFGSELLNALPKRLGLLALTLLRL